MSEGMDPGKFYGEKEIGSRQESGDLHYEPFVTKYSDIQRFILWLLEVYPEFRP